MKKYFSLIFISLALFSACSTSITSYEVIQAVKSTEDLDSEKKWALMTGRWYGNQPTKEGGNREQIIERYPDGTYKVDFRIHKMDGSFEAHSEVGYWGVSGPIYFSIFKGWLQDGKILPSSPSNPYNYDAYEIVSLSEETFKYRSFRSDNKFTLIKVGAEFQLGDQ
ncbi:hypothetical protein [Microbulbifer yueqingensis]|uniref:hypothetical protein n=1 Tax=Microbulbifer yueqingensis TaxID=658219 RepID=UPI0011143680|nr:hypothetical protein [Microbulbifer yueqingensis]